MPEKSLTVKEVAAKAGVSTATVSRVINGDSKVRPATAEKVKKIIKQSGYRINQTARSLKTSRTHTIGIVAPEFKNDFFMSIVTGIEDTLKTEGYSVVLCSSQESINEERERLKLLKEKNVDGIIIIPGSNAGEHFRLMGETPIVLVDRLVKDFRSDAVLSDNLQGSYDAVKLAALKGAQSIGFLGGNMELTSAKERFEGFKKACHDFNIHMDDKFILFGNYHEDSGYALMKQLMESSNPPKYIFISNYFMHFGAARYLLEGGQTVPELHIISFDDLPLASFFPYTSIIVAQPMEEIGRKAAELLLGRIRGDSSSYKTIRLGTSMKSLE